MVLAVLCGGGCSLVVEVLASDLGDAGPIGASDGARESCYRISPGCPEDTQTVPNSCSCYATGYRGSILQGYQLCDGLGGHLLTIETAEEQVALLEHLSVGDSDYFLGLFHFNSRWTWDTGIPLAETSFSALDDTSAPDSSTPCVELDADQGGRWRPTGCDFNDVVCEFDGLSAAL